MGLTFRKRDDFGKLMEDLGVSTEDLKTTKTSATSDKQEDPFAKFLKPKDTSKETKVNTGK
ncbi:SPJ_0845 family protein [Lactococcus ileimucosae]|uniref:SPJ_0845 family protein n=1 Tax=Lactococcus ileimucosae TaxID=2941329 RepID=A0ABV4D282_9LACT